MIISMELRNALSDARVALEKTAQAIARLTDEREQLLLEIRGLELALARHGQEHPGKNAAGGVTPVETIAARAEPIDAIDWRSLPRTDAVLRALEMVDRAASPSEIARTLKSVGRTKDSPHYVSAALSYLSKTGAVKRVGQGQWTLGGRQPRHGVIGELHTTDPQDGQRGQKQDKERPEK